jgi:hypothetical protein
VQELLDAGLYEPSDLLQAGWIDGTVQTVALQQLLHTQVLITLLLNSS